MPLACRFQLAPVNDVSVPNRRVTSYASADSCCRHCASLLTTFGTRAVTRLVPAGEKFSISTGAEAASGAEAAPAPASLKVSIAAIAPQEAVAWHSTRRRVRSGPVRFKTARSMRQVRRRCRRHDAPRDSADGNTVLHPPGREIDHRDISGGG